jgi:hypothetical protein
MFGGRDLKGCLVVAIDESFWFLVSGAGAEQAQPQQFGGGE